jgi:hypothetical protein
LVIFLLHERTADGVASLALYSSQQVGQLNAEKVECESVSLELAIVLSEEVMEAGTAEEDAVGVGAVEETGGILEVLAAEKAYYGLHTMRETEAHL